MHLTILSLTITKFDFLDVHTFKSSFLKASLAVDMIFENWKNPAAKKQRFENLNTNGQVNDDLLTL